MSMSKVRVSDYNCHTSIKTLAGNMGIMDFARNPFLLIASK
jgi:hypothetical protein